MATGLRYSEIKSITPESFALDGAAPTVTVQAAYTKNGETAILPLSGDLVEDLRQMLCGKPAGEVVFPLPTRGADMLKVDLTAAGIHYRDAAGLVFDFHALRCQAATLLAQAGNTPRVVQRLMRHSTLELTGRYTRPRMLDLERAAATLPNLRPTTSGPEALAATGTDGTHKERLAPYLIHCGDGAGRLEADAGGMVDSPSKSIASHNPLTDIGFDASGRELAVSDASSGGGTRTPDTRIMIPGVRRKKSIIGQELRPNVEPVAAPLPHDSRLMHPDLALIVERWADLPETVRSDIMAIVRTACMPRSL